MMIRTALVAAALTVTAAQAQWVLESKLRPETLDDRGWLGESVAIVGESLFAGAPIMEGPGSQQGGVAVYAWLDDEWQKSGTLYASAGDGDAKFGQACAVDADTLVVGAPGEDAGLEGRGAVYVFVQENSEWIEQARLLPSISLDRHRFGTTVDIEGDRIIVGVSSLWVPDDAGYAFIFERVDEAWQEVAALQPNDAISEMRFGISVGINNGVAFVGADYAAGNEPESGAVYVFASDTGVWEQIDRIVSHDGAEDTLFGWQLAADDGVLAIAQVHDGDLGRHAGAIYMYEAHEGGWEFVQKLTPPGLEQGDQFGFRLVLRGEHLLGFAWDDDAGRGTGVVYSFRRITDTWLCTGVLQPPDVGEESSFGYGLAIYSDHAVIGAPGDTELSRHAGAVYTYRFPECAGDYNGDDIVDTRDILAFLDAWIAGKPSSDLNGDRQNDTRDVIAFLNRWTDPC
jgi:hypothetical protein